MKKVLAVFSCFAVVCALGLGGTGCTDTKKTTPAKTTTTPAGDKTTTPAGDKTTTPAKTTT